MASVVRRRVVVTGRVQGVFFRETCRRQADAAAVCGWVTNRRDGTVEAVFEGEPQGVDALVEWCRRGPQLARVDSIRVTEEQPEGLTNFRVTH